MKPPKNFYSNLDRRKQGLPEVPEASAADAGKIIKVGSDGGYELETYNGLPAVTSSDNNKLIQVTSGEWGLTNALSDRSLVITNTSNKITSSINTGIKIVKDSTLSFMIFGISSTFNMVLTRSASVQYSILIDDRGTIYRGFISNVTSDTIYAVVTSDGINFQRVAITSSSITYAPIGFIKYYEIESSGSSVSLPSGVTFAEVYALLQAGVDVKFTDGARVYSVTSFESTNIRAHWFTDLDLTNMEVYVINLASDGTGTVASATFSGS